MSEYDPTVDPLMGIGTTPMRRATTGTQPPTNPTVPTPVAATPVIYKPTKPIMGGLSQHSATEMLAWCGGQCRLD